MKKLLQKFLQQIRQMREAAERLPDGLAPLEQNEAAAQLRWFFTGLRGHHTSLVRAMQESETAAAALEAEIDGATAQEKKALREDKAFLEEIRQSMLASGEVVAKATVTTMVETAQKNGADEERKKFNLETQRAGAVAARRKEAAVEIASALKDKHGDQAGAAGAEIAAFIPDEVLVDEAYLGSVKIVVERCSKLVGLGVISVKSLEQVAKFPTKTSAEFDLHLGHLQELAASFQPSGRSAPLAAPGAPPAAPAGKTMLVF